MSRSYYDRSYYDGFAPYVPVAQRRRKAASEAAARKKNGQTLHPVSIAGRTIARSFWGKAWCNNLEAYSDYANRLPRGRTYVRNGSVIDLAIEPGAVRALVSGSSVYRVAIRVQPLDAAPWKAIVKECAGQVASLIEVLQGRLSKAVMDLVTRPGKGLFPQPRQLGFECSCPDSASMCKHVAATLYGVGARLDDEPQLLFRLRHVEPLDLIQGVGAAAEAAASDDVQGRLAHADLSALFGIDIGEAAAAAPSAPKAGGVVKAAMAAKAEVAKAVPSAQPSKAAKPAQSVPSAQPSKAAKTAKASRGGSPVGTRPKTVAASELVARGIPRHMIAAWLDSGVLKRTAQRGVYGTGAQTGKRIEDYLARGTRR
jgi:uncharacterized Zn finger protein